MCSRALGGTGLVAAADAAARHVLSLCAGVVAGADSAATALRPFCGIVQEGRPAFEANKGTGADSVCMLKGFLI